MAVEEQLFEKLSERAAQDDTFRELILQIALLADTLDETAQEISTDQARVNPLNGAALQAVLGHLYDRAGEFGNLIQYKRTEYAAQN